MRKSIKFILLFLFAVFILWFFGRNLNWQEVSESLRKANAFYITLAVLVICFGYLLRAFRWKVLLEPITETSLKELFATTTVGFAAVFFVGRAGEIVRPMWLPMRDKRVRPSSALVTLGLERIFDLAALICFFSVTLLFFDPPEASKRDYAVQYEYIKLLGNLMLAGVFVGFIGLFVYQKYSAPIIAWFERITDRKLVPRRIRRVFLSLLQQLAASLQILKSASELFRVIFWTISLWFSIALPTWFVILAFNLPFHISLAGAMFLMFWAAMGSLIPTPGGAAGAFHEITKRGLMFLGVEENDAAAISIVMHLVYFAPALIFGFYYLFHGDISIAKFRSLLSSEHAVEEIEEGEQKTENGKRKTENEERRIEGVAPQTEH
ncbi:MAG TPA: lysylphosphatidylglycerol synthase transmembrane domain-containing protein [Pyrinomonadaceae bacterium]|nr:lysylphosphatidylglycerol synthase transmembrane domain-containing protein [Pyrinomonadaceae bacterium]